MAGLLAANKWSAGKNICRPKEQWVLNEKCSSQSGISIAISSNSNYNCINASIFWRNQCFDWSFWFRAPGLCSSPCLLQLDLQTIKKEPHFLDKYYHSCCFWKLGSHSNCCSSKANKPWCKKLSAIRQCLIKCLIKRV